jgi:hypothetical protein
MEEVTMMNSQEVLAAAARTALAAPSMLNTQPWHWTVGVDHLELRGDRTRRLEIVDPIGRFLLLSCGIALHHACVSIAAAGYLPVVERTVHSFDDDLLARVRLGPPQPVDIADTALFDAISQRRTDRRPYGDDPVPSTAVDAMREAVRSAGAGLHRVGLDQMPMLAIAVAQAGALEMAEPEYRLELTRWINRPWWSNDGVPAAATTQPAPRRVPMRTLALTPQSGVPVRPGGDRGSAYFVIFGDGDGAEDWLRAGEATSAAMLTATALDLAVSPISDVIEVGHPRELVRGLLQGQGFPYLVLRCGWPPTDGGAAAVPRRDASEVIIDEADARP